MTAYDENQALERDPAGLPSYSDLRVLIVDDDEFMCELAEAMLTSLGVAGVVKAGDGDQALRALERECFDLVLCDLNMPRMDGAEFMRFLAQRRYTGGIVLVSGEDKRILQTAQALAAAHNLNALGTLEKPFALDSLAQMLERRGQAFLQGKGAVAADISPDDLRRALRERELFLMYQPKVTIAGRQVTGVEALVRWRHPVNGVVSPVRFISVAEEHGMIDQVFDFVFSEAVRQAAQWHEAGHPLKMSVNVSMDNLDRLDLPDIIAATSARVGLPLSAVILEVTESRLNQNLAKSLEILTRLRLKGVGLSIDDFGTGYSSMEQLRNIPFVELKIDRAFVHGAAQDAAARAILESSVELARKLGLSIVAEGVETEEDWNLVAQLGCELVQGYLIAKPMPGAHILEFIGSR